MPTALYLRQDNSNYIRIDVDTTSTDIFLYYNKYFNNAYTGQILLKHSTSASTGSNYVSTSDEDYLKLKSLFRGPYFGNAANWNAGNIPTRWYIGSTTNTNPTTRWAQFSAGDQSSYPYTQVVYYPHRDGVNYSSKVI